MPTRRIAIYPGSFDPLTLGHVDIIQRGSALFDSIIVAVLRNVEKSPLFTVDERLEMIRHTFRDRANVEADSFSGLLVDYVSSRKATTIVRGIRAISDFEYEFQMALMNRRLSPGIETVFMMPAEEYSYVSSRLVKEVASLGGDVSGLLPEDVEKKLLERVRRRASEASEASEG
jgi:pantetheine-phosphate adenylyltransferase